MIKEIKACRLCQSASLTSILDLGRQALTGIFPANKSENIDLAPLELVKCGSCGLVQLKHSCQPEKLYGINYGYRSGLNQSMVTHLNQTASMLKELVNLQQNDVVLDIGSNDGTLLSFLTKDTANLIGIDPAAEKFKQYYPSGVNLICDFFSADLFKANFGPQKVKIITSISMFYDLESPLDFAKHVYELLEDEGIWHLEQSYLTSMLDVNAYDTVCHEHLEYYALKQIKWICDEVGFKIIKLNCNDVNGGSFAVTVSKKEASYAEAEKDIEAMLQREQELGLDNLDTYRQFEARVNKMSDDLIQLLTKLKSENKLVCGYGASTKGNVVLQHNKIDESLLSVIAEVNEDKYGCYTPGSRIPIMSDDEVRRLKPDYYLVLPWHFRKNILAREQNYLDNGGKFIFPLPEVEIVAK